MKKILSIFLICTPIIAFCGYTSRDVQGSWKEISRRNNNNEYLRFKDTMKIDFFSGNECLFQERNGYVSRNNYSIEPTGIEMGDRFFNLLYIDGNLMLLGDETGFYKFKRYKPAANDFQSKGLYSTTATYSPKEYYYPPTNTVKPQTTATTSSYSSHSSTSYWSVHQRASEVQAQNNNSAEAIPASNYPAQQKTEQVYIVERASATNNSQRRTAGQLTGNWREVSRRNAGNQNINFADTIFVEFRQGNEYVWHKIGSFIYRGTYTKSGNALDLGMRNFDIISNDGYNLTMTDGTAIYEFESYVPVPSAPEYRAPEVYDPVNSLRQMVGHWSVYKRTNGNIKPADIDYTRQLKMIDIYNNDGQGIMGDFFGQRDADNAPSWYVESYNNQIIYCYGKDRRQFHVIKCQDNELIIEENGTTYYFKQFR
ncbi:MAG: hypothetical protein JST82_07595 [Bacteroidetes bacterium]|nr:hypothetical protein [Bacteroidota bacterium]